MSVASVGYATDRGLRPSNQDAVVAVVLPDGREVVAVADGMGGHAAGEVASATALSALVDALHRGAGLEAAYRAADEAVRSAVERDPALDGMGTTLVTLLREGNRYWIGNVGDSRAYRVSAAEIARLTRDHSFTEEAVRSGRMSEEEVARSPWKNALTRAIGTGDDVDVDVFGPFGGDEPHAVLLCTDGLHGAVPEEEIRACVVASGDTAAAAERLPALALRHGSRDNVTAALLDFGLLRTGEAAERAPAPPSAIPAPPMWSPPPAAARPARRRAARGRRKRSLPAEGLVYAACCGALAAWLVYFLSSF